MIFSMRHRSDEHELIDLGTDYYSIEEYRDCMRKLGGVGRLLGGNSATLAAFNLLKDTPSSILDVGCGGGDNTRLLAKHYPNCKIDGIDFSTEAIQLANEHTNNRLYPNLSFSVPPTLELNCPRKSYDVVTATLVCHHMSDEALVDFLKRAASVAKNAIIINDLHRHPIAYGAYFIVAPLLFNNRLITHDGLISVKRGFTKDEWVQYLDQAGFNRKQWSIKWNWAFRWTIVINLKNI